MLHEFLTSNRNELIQRCRAKAVKRFPKIPAAIPAIADKGVPLFLAQLVDTLREEQLTATRGPPPQGRADPRAHRNRSRRRTARG